MGRYLRQQSGRQGQAECATPGAVPGWCLGTQAIRTCPWIPILGFTHRFQTPETVFVPGQFPSAQWAGIDEGRGSEIHPVYEIEVVKWI